MPTYINLDNLTRYDAKIKNFVQTLLTSYYTKQETYSKTEVNTIIGNLETIQIEVVQSLPASGQSNIIYLVPKASPLTGYIEYIWVASANTFEEIGDTDIDLSNYYTKNQVYNKTEIDSTFYNKEYIETNVEVIDLEASTISPGSTQQYVFSSNSLVYQQITSGKACLMKVGTHYLKRIASNVFKNYDIVTSNNGNKCSMLLEKVACNVTENDVTCTCTGEYVYTYTDDYLDEKLKEVIEASQNVTDTVKYKISGATDGLALPSKSQEELVEVKGNSVVRNNYVPANERNYTNITPDTKTVFNFQIQALSGGTFLSILFGQNISSTGLVAVIIDVPSNINGDALRIKHNGSVTDLPLINNLSMPVIANHKIFVELYVSGYNPSVSGGLSTKDLVVIDLTQWFNGNVPSGLTADKFIAEYGDMIPSTQDLGTIVNSNGKLVSTGRNLWDEVWEVGDVNVNTGATTSGNRIVSKNLIRLMPNTTYYANVNYVATIYFYDINGNYLGLYANPNEQSLFTTPNNAYYGKIRTLTNYGTTYNHDICVNYSDTNFNSTYEPYVEHEITLPELRSAGNVSDTIKAGKKITKIGKDTFTNSTAWSTSTTNVYIADLTNRALDKTALLSNGYTVVTTYSECVNTNKSVYIGGTNNNQVYIHDNDSADTTAIQSAMAGQTLYYALATPTEEEYNEPLYLTVYNNGSEQQTSEVPYTITRNYDISIKDQVLTNVQVDAEQQKQIEALKKLLEPTLLWENASPSSDFTDTDVVTNVSQLPYSYFIVEFAYDKYNLGIVESVKIKLNDLSKNGMVTYSKFIGTEFDTIYRTIVYDKTNVKLKVTTAMNSQANTTDFNGYLIPVKVYGANL